MFYEQDISDTDLLEKEIVSDIIQMHVLSNAIKTDPY